MDNFTHSLVGALIGQAGLKKKTGLGMAALIIGANMPDVDAACFFWLEGTEHLAFRRGITHGPIAWLVLPLMLAAILYGWDKWQARRGKRPVGRLPVHFGWLFALSLIGCLTHPALDWMNVYGIRFLEPFSHQWFYGDVLFIIDIWLWLGLGIGLWLSLRQEKRGGNWQMTARNVLGLVGLYLVANWLISDLDRRANPAFPATISAPVAALFWQRETIGVSGSGTFYRDGAKLGNLPLNACDLDAARASDPQIAAFAFWSRAPVLDRMEDGRIMLGDARYYDPLSRGQFEVEIPAHFCAEPAAG